MCVMRSNTSLTLLIQLAEQGAHLDNTMEASTMVSFKSYLTSCLFKPVWMMSLYLHFLHTQFLVLQACCIYMWFIFLWCLLFMFCIFCTSNLVWLWLLRWYFYLFPVKKMPSLKFISKWFVFQCVACRFIFAFKCTCLDPMWSNYMSAVLFNILSLFQVTTQPRSSQSTKISSPKFQNLLQRRRITRLFMKLCT